MMITFKVKIARTLTETLITIKIKFLISQVNFIWIKLNETPNYNSKEFKLNIKYVLHKSEMNNRAYSH